VSLPAHISVPDFDEWGMTAFTSRRDAGSFGTGAEEPVNAVLGRWDLLRSGIAALGVSRLASATQVHGDRVIVHGGEWDGWLRTDSADGHAWMTAGTSAVVTIADCVPVFIGHPSGAAAILHSGWRGTAAGITERAIDQFTRHGFAASSLRIHLGPSICGSCYEVSPDVYRILTGSTVSQPTAVDLREVILVGARQLGVRDISISEWCTRCSNDRLFSHRAGDAGRQLGVMISPPRR
jgi:polyphenol oxidase